MPSAPLPLPQTFTHARELIVRFREAEGLGIYLAERRALITAALFGFMLIATAGAVGTVAFLAERHPLLALPGLALAPLLLLGSLFVQVYLLFAWLEARALAQVFGRPARRTPVPWALAALFIGLPLALLAAVAA